MKFKEYLNESYNSYSIQTSDIPFELKKAIRTIQSSIPKDKLSIIEDSSDWVKNGLQKLLHVTILYGCNKDPFELVRQYFQLFETGLEVITDGIDYFDNETDQFTVAIIKVKSEDMEDLHYGLKDELENKHKKTFKPHLTIAYLKYGERLSLKGMPSIFSKWNIRSIEISGPDGNVQSIIC